MKKVITILTIIGCIVLSCEPLEVEIQDTFDFEISSTYENTNFISQAIETQIKITPERKVTDTKYFISYKNLTGEGYLKKGNEILFEEQEYEVENLELFLQYFGESVENHKVQLTIRDSNELIKIHLLNYKILAETDFIFQAITNSETIYLTEENQLFFELEALENELNEDITYTFSLSQINQPGTFIFNMEELSLLQTVEIEPGNFQGIFLADNFGTSALTFTVEASNGISHTQTVTFEVLQTDFNFTVIPEETSDYVKDKTTFHFNIEKEGIEDLTYTMVFSGQNGRFDYTGNNYVTGQQISSISESTFEMIYQSNEITNEDLTITLTASNGITKTIEVEYESLATDFEIVITPNQMSTIFAFPQVFEMAIVPPNVDDYEVEYTMYYESTVGSVTLELFDLDFTGSTIPGSIIDFGTAYQTSGNVIQLGNVGPREGELTFYFTDSNGVTNSKTVQVDWH